MFSSLKTQFALAEHSGSHRTALHSIDGEINHPTSFSLKGNDWEFCLRTETASASYTLNAKLLHGEAAETAFGLSITDDEWSSKNYVLIPGAVYGGNRFHSQPYAYKPPVVGSSLSEEDRTPWIGDLPRLSKGPGKSHLDQESHDAATPALGIYFPARKKALCLLTAQKNTLGTFGYEIIESEDRSSAQILLMAPGMRHGKYFQISGGYVNESQDTAADFTEGMSVDIDFDLHWFDCGSVQELFDFVFEHRYDRFETKPLKNEISFSATWDILHQKHNNTNWQKDLNLYQVSINDDPPSPPLLFQTGWTGGMITPFPMIQEGDAQSIERALKNMEFFFETGSQTDYGLFHEYYHSDEWFSNVKLNWTEANEIEFTHDPEKHWTLVRRIGDALFFITRSFMLLEQREMAASIKPLWKERTRKAAEAIIDIWERQSEFGQYIDVYTGNVKVAGSTAAALIPAALVVASDYFNEPEWLRVAEKIGEKFRIEDLRSGITTGGPGDCVQAPDSESVAALIESFILLYEKTGTAKWLKAAEDAVVQTASWALSYDYEFPEGSALHEIKAQSRGAFIANAQNKTGVPGICTLSGQSILRVYRATGNEKYLTLLKEISHTIPQYMGRDDKKIPTRLGWGRKGLTELPTGWICERVNVTQWGEKPGEIAAYSCWCEVAMMLTWCDIPGIYLQPDSGKVWVSDHVEAELVQKDGKQVLKITNPTMFDARVRIMIENSTAAKTALPINFAAELPTLEIKSQETLNYAL